MIQVANFHENRISLYGFTWTEHRISLKSVKKSVKYE
jgi:hypothetical protein